MKFHDELNPKIWNKEENKGETSYSLKPEVADKLMEIASFFIESNSIPEDAIEDIRLLGSSANFNYNKYSDIDLHLVVDFDKLHEDCPIVNDYAWAIKQIFNQEHEISIYDIPVEIYIESVNQPANSNGVYSLIDQNWLKKPEKIEPTDNDVAVQAKFEEISQAIDKIEDSEYADELLDKIYAMRKSGLAEEGEFSTENLAFKLLRNGGYLDRLRKMKKANIDKELTLEKYEVSEKLIDGLKAQYPKANIEVGHGTIDVKDEDGEIIICGDYSVVAKFLADNRNRFENYIGEKQTMKKKMNENLQQEYDEFTKGGRMPLVVIDTAENSHEIYFEPQGNKVVFGYATNAGINPTWEFDYDDFHSFDWNFQGMVEEIQGELYEEEGYPVDESLKPSRKSSRKMNEEVLGTVYELPSMVGRYEVADMLTYAMIDENKVNVELPEIIEYKKRPYVEHNTEYVIGLFINLDEDLGEYTIEPRYNGWINQNPDEYGKVILDKDIDKDSIALFEDIWNQMKEFSKIIDVDFIKEKINEKSESLKPSRKLSRKMNEDADDEEKEVIWDYLVEYGIATDEEIRLVTSINGYSVETLNDIIYARTGFRNLEQLKSEYGEDEDMEESLKSVNEGNFDQQSTAWYDFCKYVKEKAESSEDFDEAVWAEADDLVYTSDIINVWSNMPGNLGSRTNEITELMKRDIIEGATDAQEWIMGMDESLEVNEISDETVDNALSKRNQAYIYAKKKWADKMFDGSSKKEQNKAWKEKEQALDKWWSAEEMVARRKARKAQSESVVNEISNELKDKVTDARKKELKNADRVFVAARNKAWKDTEGMEPKARKEAIMNNDKLNRAEDRANKAARKLVNNRMLRKAQSESLADSILKEAHEVLSMNESADATTWSFKANGFSKAMVEKQNVFGNSEVRCVITENTNGKLEGTATVNYFMTKEQIEEAIKNALRENGFRTTVISELVNLY